MLHLSRGLLLYKHLSQKFMKIWCKHQGKWSWSHVLLSVQSPKAYST
jgi:hypothetical protein